MPKHKQTKIQAGNTVQVTKGKGKDFSRLADVPMVVYSPESDIVEEKQKRKGK